MANELQAASEGVRSLARQYKGVLALGEALGKLGDLDAHREELTRQRDAAKAELDAVIASLASARAVKELEKAKKAAQAEVDRAKFDLENARAALTDINGQRAAAEASVKALRIEAAEVEKKLATMRADIDAIKSRYGS